MNRESGKIMGGMNMTKRILSLALALVLCLSLLSVSAMAEDGSHKLTV